MQTMMDHCVNGVIGLIQSQVKEVSDVQARRVRVSRLESGHDSTTD